MRVVIGTGYSTEADNVHVYGGHVFAQLLQHVSKASWDRFQDNAYWWWVMVSTNGIMEMTRYNVGSHKHRGTNRVRRSIEWYVQLAGLLPKPSYSHQANGNGVQGVLYDLESNVKKGQCVPLCQQQTGFLPTPECRHCLPG